jgi:hypothetical protein
VKGTIQGKSVGGNGHLDRTLSELKFEALEIKKDNNEKPRVRAGTAADIKKV